MEKDDDSNSQLYIVLILAYLVIYKLFSSFLEHYQYPIHRSTISIIIGIIAGLVLSQATPQTYKEIAKFDQIVIFSILFPPMTFAQGYTLHKNVFFKNIKNVLIFGVLGTFISFVMSWGLLYQANQLNLVIDSKDIHNYRTLSQWQILILSACLCSIDTTASEQSINQKKYPRIYSIVFGEDILKDTITIVLVNSIIKLYKQEGQSDDLVIYWYTFFQVMLTFLIVIMGSIAFGLISSGIACFVSKKCRFMKVDGGITQTWFLFGLGFITYILTELCEFSGAISLLLYGVLLNHYNFYNMQKASWQTSVNTFTLLSDIAEGLLFLIMGIMVFQGEWQSSSDSHITHSWIFFGVTLTILFFTRIANVYLLGFINNFFVKAKNKFNLKELHIIYLSGIVRGAVPFILFSSINLARDKYSKNQGIILKTTIIFIIIFTSVIFNSLIPYIYKKKLLPSIKKQQQEPLLPKEIPAKDEKQSQVKEIKKSKMKGRIKWFQQTYIKPFLIFDYENRRQQIKKFKQQRKKQLDQQQKNDEQKLISSQYSLNQ